MTEVVSYTGVSLAYIHKHNAICEQIVACILLRVSGCCLFTFKHMDSIAPRARTLLGQPTVRRVSPSEPAVRPRHAHDAYTLGIPHAVLTRPIHNTGRHPRSVVPGLMPCLPQGMAHAADRLDLSRPHTQLEDDSTSCVSVSSGVSASLLELSTAVDTGAEHPTGRGLQTMHAASLDLNRCCLAGAMVHRPLFPVDRDGRCGVVVLRAVSWAMAVAC